MEIITLKTRRVLSQLLFLLLALGGYSTVYSQTQIPECNSDVPFFVVDMSANPDSTYTTPEIVRNGQCCGDGSNQNYVSFYVTLHPDVAMVEIGIDPGYADPGGSGFYNIVSGGDLVTPGACGVNIPGGTSTCITGSGPHKITYHKPGSNKVRYTVKQIPRPIFPADDTTRVGCDLPLNIYGLDTIQINSINSSTGNTTLGAYNDLLSCIDCSTPYFSPVSSTPQWIDYQICGYPIATACGVYESCDTVRVYTMAALNVSVTPDPASFCSGGSVVITATAVGGDGNYTLTWLDSDLNFLEAGAVHTADYEGNHTVEVLDGLISQTCPAKYLTVPVQEGEPPVVDAGPDQTACASDPTVFLAGSSTSGSGVWSGGNGTYAPSPNDFLINYTPTLTELQAGFVELYLEATGVGLGCTTTEDTVVITFADTVKLNPTFPDILCNGGSTIVTPNASGGNAPYKYTWSTGENTSTLNASAGTYYVSALDINGCEAFEYFTVNEPSLLQLTMTSVPETADGANDGEATVSIFGGTPPYSILWYADGNQTTNTITGLSYGIHPVQVTDANGCTVNESVVVNNVSCASFEVSIINNNDVTCYGGTDGDAEALATGGTPNYTYSWNTAPIQSTAAATGLSSGTYVVTATDDNGCLSQASVTIFQPTVITNTMTHTDATSIGGTDGTATANPMGGNPGYTYSWTPIIQATQTAVNLDAQTHYVLITDNNTCTKLDSVLINQPPCNDFILAVNATDIKCFGETNGSANLVIAQGTPPFSIVWSSGETDVMSVNNLAAGSYTVTVTDAQGCTTFTTFDITEPDDITLALDVQNVTCYGAGDGTIDLTVLGGTYPYTFEWYQGTKLIGESEDMLNLSNGTYYVEVTDANECSATAGAGVTQPNKINITDVATDITCAGDGDGAINMTPTGGTLPYTYSWTGPDLFTSTTQDISGLEAGQYNVTLLDASGCIGLHSSYINEPDTVVIFDFSVECPIPGDNMAVVSIDSIQGGQLGEYQISYDGSVYGAFGDYTSSQMVGMTYTVYAMDSNMCVTPNPVSIIVDPTVEITAINFDPCIAPATANIDITVVPTGGDGTYEVSTDGGATWNPAGTLVISVAVGSDYDVVIRDSKGCESVAQTIIIPQPFEVVEDNMTPVSCLGGSDGAIDITASGGTVSGSYTYLWTGPLGYTSSDEDISGLLDGAYNVEVTDDSLCTFNLGVTVTTIVDVTPPSITCPVTPGTTVSTDVDNCTYTQSGTSWDATATDNCSVNTVTYVLTGATIGTGTTLDGVVFNQGVTTVEWTAEDVLGNTDVCSYTVTVNDDQEPSISSCGGSGTQNVNSDIGVCTYTHAGSGWDPTTSDNCTAINSVSYTVTGAGANPSTGSTLDGVEFNLGTSTVTWTVTDDAGNSTTCTFDVEVTDNQDPTFISCGPGGDQNEVVDIDACTYTHSGNAWDAVGDDNCTTFTMTYVLSGATTGSGSNTLNGVEFELGTTTVTWTVTDDAGNFDTCTFDVIITDDQLPQISSCGPSGNQTVNANLGTCTYTYSGTGWNAQATDNCTISTIVYNLSGATSGSGTSLNGQVFNLGVTLVLWTVTDNSGNISTCSFEVTVLDDQDPIISSCGAVGTQNVSTDLGVCTYTNSGTGWDASATDNCSVSSIVYTLTGATIGSGNTTLDGVTFAQGTTYVTWTVMDGSGNTDVCNFTVIVSDDELPSISNCPSDVTTSNDAGDCGAIVSWTPPTADDNCGVTSFVSTHNPGDFFSIGTTTVTYTATDNAGNNSYCSFDITITDDELPVLSCQSDYESCDSLVTFSIPTVTDNCGISSVTQTAGLPSGSFFPIGTTTVTFEAIDVNGNINTCSFDVIINSTPEATSVSTDVSCFGFGDGEIDATVTNGTIPYTYSWSNGASSEDLSNLSPGIYVLTVVDAKGCSTSLTDTIAEPDQLLVSKEVEQVTCYNDMNGSIDLFVSGGILPYTYAWNTGATSEDLIGLDIGNYNVVVTDANGCTVATSASIIQPDSIEIQSNVSVATCGADNGSIITLITGGTSPYTYSWDTGANTANLNNVAAGTYTLTVTDFNLCTAVLTETVGASSNLEAYAITEDVECYGEENGSAILIIESGNEPYDILWSNGATTPTVSELPAGDYSVTVVDNFSCEVTVDITIDQPDSLVVTLYSTELIPGYNISPHGASNGSIESYVTGGVPEYEYFWTPNGETSADLYGLPYNPTGYTVYVTDQNRCVATASIIITEPGALEIPEGVSPNNDGDNDVFVVRGIEGYPDNEIIIYNRWGNVVYQQSGYQNDWGGVNNKGEELPDGTYYVVFIAKEGQEEITLTGFIDLRRY